MKRTLLALAALGSFAGAASAQSSVTLYGDIDLSITKGNGGTAFNQGGNGSSAASGKAWQVKQSHTSRLGFRGNEDLGGGLSAQFQIEHRFNPDTGTQNNANTFWFGRSYVQLTSVAVGSVYLGREYIPAFFPAVKSDPFGFDGVGQLGTVMYANYSVNDRENFADATGGTSRTNNTIGYKSPNLSGLTVQIAGAASEGNTFKGSTSSPGREFGANVEYSAGPIYGALAYDKTQRGSAAYDGNSLLSGALHYNFGFAKAMLYGARAKVGVNSAATNKYASISLLAPVGPGNVKAAFGYYDPAGASNTNRKFGLGYDYSLSKRTNLYADVGHARQSSRSSNTAYAFGIKHLF